MGHTLENQVDIAVVEILVPRLWRISFNGSCDVKLLFLDVVVVPGDSFVAHNRN